MLPPVFDAAGGAGSDFVDGLRKQLGGKRCPDDETFATQLASQPLYSTAEKNARLRLILERLELSFNHKESAELSGTQIEHVLPQTWTEDWPFGDGDYLTPYSLDPRALARRASLNTFGNLTLVKDSLNISSGNKSFLDKKLKFEEHTGLFLNKWFSSRDTWSESEIHERGEHMVKMAIHTWPSLDHF